MLILCDIAIITVKGVDYGWIIHDMNKSEVAHLLENSVLDDRGFIQSTCQKINTGNSV